MILGIREVVPPPGLLEAIRAGRVAGLLWFRNALGRTVEEAQERVRSMRAEWPGSTRPVFAIDEEGGLIQQLCGLLDPDGAPWLRLPSPRALGRCGEVALVTAHGREIGRRMRLLDLDVALAPVVDLDPGPESHVLGTRCFGNDPDRVSELALAWLRGLSEAGVQGCIKHYPGHGASVDDSHERLPRITQATAAARHLRPFETIARRWSPKGRPAPGILVAHVICEPAEMPATLDPLLLRLVPPGLGPIWTDSLDMGALDAFGDLVDRGRLAERAGAEFLVVGIDLEGGLRLANALAKDAGGVARRMDASARENVPIPDPWDLDTMRRAAAAGLRILDEQRMPEGEWDWILPDAFGPYGSIAKPDQARRGNRWIGAVRTYQSDSPRALGELLAIPSPDRPALVGLIHRGPPDSTLIETLRTHADRIGAIIHLLDGPSGMGAFDCWVAETCGFGDLEIAALKELWEKA